jgi:hypothetical protein
MVNGGGGGAQRLVFLRAYDVGYVYVAYVLYVWYRTSYNNQ